MRDDNSRAVTVDVDAGRAAPFTIPETLFGTFTENIWDAVYGGLWAQLLHNPSFEPDYLSAQNFSDAARYGRLVTDPSFGSGYVRVEPLVEPSTEPDRGRFLRSSALGLPLPWEALRHAGVRYEPRDGDAANSYRSLLVMGLEGREVGVRQGIYLPTHRTLKYTGSFWVKVVTGGREARRPGVEVSLRRRDRPDEVLARANLALPEPGSWSRLEFGLELPEAGVRPLEKVDFCISLGGEQRALVDNVLLWPADHIGGFDPEVLEAARALRTTLLRFGGNFVSGYHWRDGVGPFEKRRTILNQAWGLPEYNHFGTDEFVRFSRLVGAEPQIAVNAGSGEAEEAAAWVEYCNGPATSRYGALRAANGHPEPYNVKYWEVGNELWGDFQIGWQTPATNARRYVEFARALRRVAPDARLIATGADVDFFREWNGELIRVAGPDLDLLSTHLVIGMQPGEQLRKDADDDFTHRADFAVPVGVGRKLDEMRAQVEADPRTRGRVKFAFNEWQFWSPRENDPRFTNLGGAVNAAAFLNMLARRADFVPASNMSNVVQFAGIHRQRGRVFVTPSYHVLRLYRDAAGSRPLAVTVRTPMYDVHEGNRRVPEIPEVPSVDVLAALSPAGDVLRLYVVNRDFRVGVPLAVKLEGFKHGATGVVHQLRAESFEAANSPQDPARVTVRTSKIALDAAGFRILLPKHSLSVVEIGRG